jgi:hypothetical protein
MSLISTGSISLDSTFDVSLGGEKTREEVAWASLLIHSLREYGTYTVLADEACLDKLSEASIFSHLDENNISKRKK